jgi:hypothetical protein
MRAKKRQGGRRNNNERQSYPEQYRDRPSIEYRDQFLAKEQLSDVREDERGTFVWSDPYEEAYYQSPDSVYEALPRSRKIYGDFSQYGASVGQYLPMRYYAYLDNGDGTLRLDDRANRTMGTPEWYRNMEHGFYGADKAREIRSQGGDINDMLDFLGKTRYTYRH